MCDSRPLLHGEHAAVAHRGIRQWQPRWRTGLQRPHQAEELAVAAEMTSTRQLRVVAP